MKRLKFASMAAVPAFVAALLFAPATADAQSAYLDGAFGAKPKWSSIKNPHVEPITAQPCSTGCTELHYNAWPSQSGFKTGFDALNKWFDTGTRSANDTVWAYSNGAVIASAVIRKRGVNDTEVKSVNFVMLGSPDSPHTGGNATKYDAVPGTGLPSNLNGDVTYVVVQYDSVADVPDKKGAYSSQNLSFSVHMNGYDNIDLNAPENIHWTDPATGAKIIFVPTKVLPMLRWRDWFTSDAEMARLDVKYRPLIEADYNRPWQAQVNAAQLPQQAQTAAVQSKTASVADVSDTPQSGDEVTNEPAARPKRVATDSHKRVRAESNKVDERLDADQSESPTQAPAEVQEQEKEGTPKQTRAEKRAEAKEAREAKRQERKQAKQDSEADSKTKPSKDESRSDNESSDTGKAGSNRSNRSDR